MENLPIFSKFIFIFGAFLLLTFYFSYLKSKCDFVKALSCCFVYFTLLFNFRFTSLTAQSSRLF